MSDALSQRYITVEEYLDGEETAEQKSEYYNGEVFAMSGGSYTHSTIKGNVFGELRTRLRGKFCRPSDSDMRVLVPSTTLHVYPDVSVVCGKPLFTNSKEHTLINPSLVVEVLSPSTERYDRTAKFWHYQTIESFTGYVLVTQDSPQVEHFYRNSEGEWLYRAYKGLDAILLLPEQQTELPLIDIYENVNFRPSVGPSEDNPPHPGPPSL